MLLALVYQKQNNDKSSGLKVGTVHKVSSDTVESGYVIKTSPTAGSSKKKGHQLIFTYQKAHQDSR